MSPCQLAAGVAGSCDEQWRGRRQAGAAIQDAARALEWCWRVPSREQAGTRPVFAFLRASSLLELSTGVFVLLRVSNLTFELTGLTRLAGAGPVERWVRLLLGRARRCIAFAQAASEQDELEGRVRKVPLHDAELALRGAGWQGGF